MNIIILVIASAIILAIVSELSIIKEYRKLRTSRKKLENTADNITKDLNND